MVGDTNFNLIILTGATVRLLDYDLITANNRNSTRALPTWFNKSRPYVLEIENSTRKYILSAKSRADVYEWYKAIYGHIEMVSENHNLLRNF